MGDCVVFVGAFLRWGEGLLWALVSVGVWGLDHFFVSDVFLGFFYVLYIRVYYDFRLMYYFG